MADFSKALPRVLEFEGLYSNDEADSGGETVLGCSRNNFPDLPLWAIVDGFKKLPNFPKNMKDNAGILRLVGDWYKTEFWDKVHGDEINDQNVAYNIFDFAVNAGVYRGSKVAQQVVNAQPDGVIGEKSIVAINAYDPEKFISQYKVRRAAFYQNIVDNNPSQHVFLAGWLNRVEQC